MQYVFFIRSSVGGKKYVTRRRNKSGLDYDYGEMSLNPRR